MKKNVHSATYGSDVRSRPAALEDRTIKRRGLLCPLSMFACGLLLGAAVRYFLPDARRDILTVSVWILLGTLIAIYSPTMKDAALNILPFCLGMLFTYYAAAMLTHGVYGWSFIIGWTVFALLSPLMACLTHITKRRGVIPKVIGTGIVLVSVASGVLLFDRLRIYDIIIDGFLVYFIFFAKTCRQLPRNENREDIS